MRDFVRLQWFIETVSDLNRIRIDWTRLPEVEERGDRNRGGYRPVVSETSRSPNGTGDISSSRKPDSSFSPSAYSVDVMSRSVASPCWPSRHRVVSAGTPGTSAVASPGSVTTPIASTPSSRRLPCLLARDPFTISGQQARHGITRYHHSTTPRGRLQCTFPWWTERPVPTGRREWQSHEPAIEHSYGEQDQSGTKAAGASETPGHWTMSSQAIPRSAAGTTACYAPRSLEDPVAKPNAATRDAPWYSRPAQRSGPTSLVANTKSPS